MTDLLPNLGAWHAEPLPDAETRLAVLRMASLWHERLEALHLRLMLGLPSEMQRDVLWNEADNEVQRAAVELITGQVMLARRQKGAWLWLDAAEKRLAQHLSGRDYITLLRRHAVLRSLALFDVARPVRPLDELLAIARATAQLEGLQRKDYSQDTRDTLG
ncbi:MAG: hypothetical protein AB7S56_08405 [Halothiobacillaceae bacterium]